MPLKPDITKQASFLSEDEGQEGDGSRTDLLAIMVEHLNGDYSFPILGLCRKQKTLVNTPKTTLSDLQQPAEIIGGGL